MGFTKNQEMAIRESGQNILVSAAAGSGKTAVLVERIIRSLVRKEDPADIDRILVMTFTKAAAGEMRDRILKAINAYLRETPEGKAQTQKNGKAEGGENDGAVFSLNGEIKIKSPLGITTPAGGKLGDNNRSICEADGETPASKVVIEKKAFVMGDADGDGDLDARDKAILNRYLAGWDGYKEQIVNTAAMDFDGDGNVNAKDKAILNRFLAGWDGYDKYFQ